MRSALVGLLLLMSVTGGAQTPTQKERTDQFFQVRGQLQKQAKTAFDSEMARGKAGDCRNADNTREINACLGGEVETSTANFKVYAGALRAMLAQQNPYGGAANGSGEPRNFDQTETAWGKYREAMCSDATELYKGGTIVRAMAYTCELMMLRSHMRELAAVYGEYLRH